MSLNDKSENTKETRSQAADEAKEAQNRMKAIRKGHRARSSTLVNELTQQLAEAEPNVTLIKFKLQSLTKQREKLERYNEELQEILPPDEIETDYNESAERDEQIQMFIVKVEQFLQSLSGVDKPPLEIITTVNSQKSDRSDVQSQQSSEHSAREEFVRQRLAKHKDKLFMCQTLIQETMNELENSLGEGSPNIFNVKAVRKELIQLQVKIVDLNNEIEQILPNEEKLNFVREANQFQRNINRQLEITEEFINRKPGNNTSTHDSVESSFRLAKLELGKFGGDVCQYLSWKAAFLSAVSNSKISTTEKHRHLRRALFGNALKLVAGLPETDEHYEQVLQILDDNFDDPVKIVRTHLDKLFSLTKPNYDYKSLMDFSANMEIHLRALQAHDVGRSECTSCSILVSHQLAKLLPTEVKKEVHETRKNNHWNIEFVRTAISESLKCLREEYVEEKSGPSTRPKANFNKHSNFRRPKVANKGKPAYSSGLNPESPIWSAPQTTMAATATNQESVDRRYNCRFCNAVGHFESNCPTYTTLVARKKILIERGRCLLCLRDNHTTPQCPRYVKPCYYCKAPSAHHSAMCDKLTEERRSNSQNQASTSSSQATTATHVVHASSHTLDSSVTKTQASVALPMAYLTLKNNNCKFYARCLFDQGSQRSLARRSLIDRMRIQPERYVGLRINGINSPGDLKQYGIVSICIVTEEGPITVEVLIMDELPTELHIPNLSSTTNLLQASKIKLANPNPSDTTTDLELLIGGDYYALFVKHPLQFNNIHLLDSKVGFLIWGRLPTSSSDPTVAINTAAIFTANVAAPEIPSSETTPEQDLDILWNLSHIGIKPTDMTPVEKGVMFDFKENLTFEQGRYSVRLPWKSATANLPVNYSQAKRILHGTLNKLRKDPQKLMLYDNVFKEQEALGFIEEVKPSTPISTNARLHYLPHHAVYKDSETTPLRIVFNSSSGKPSLNDNLWPGPCLLTNICELLLRFRMKPWASISDIAKAFHQVSLHPDDQDSTRFLWVENPADPQSRMKTFRFKVVVFGINSSPFLLNACLQHHLLNSEEELAPLILKNLYVDNLMGTFEEKSDLMTYYRTANSLMERAGFDLRAWNSNVAEAKEYFREDNKGSNIECEKVLGTIWNTVEDVMCYPTKGLNMDANTKRAVLKVVASIFDPLGHLSPVTIKGKIFLQKLWKAKLRWDQSISHLHPELTQEWQDICRELQRSLSLTIPRQLIFNSEVEIHAFSDASGTAYGTAIYVVSCGNSRLLISKAKVAPLKNEITIPKLELTAALLSARLVHFVKTAFESELTILRSYCWSDSQVVLRWIASTSQQKPYIQNRKEEIAQLVPDAIWNYVPTQDNPSDYISRGVSCKKLQSDLWLKGPDWLPFPPDWPHWDEQDREPPDIETLELESSEVSSYILNDSPDREICIDVTRHSSLNKLYRVTQLVFRFIKNSRPKTKNRLTSKRVKGIFSHRFSAAEVKKTELFWLQHIQRSSFPNEVFKPKRSFPKHSTYSKFNVFFDEKSELLRCNRRLGNSDLPPEVTFPILLPENNHFVELLIKQIHETHSHISVPHLVSLLRDKYFFVRMRQICKRVLRKCLLCKRLQGKPFPSAPVSTLPSSRVNERRPFSIIGVDYSGHFFVKDSFEITKVYIALFSCTVTRAVHLEVVDDNSVETFLRALRRFAARRGCPEVIYSDNGTYLVAASAYLKTIQELPSVQEYLKEHRIEWRFNPARASFYGGHFERLISIVKSCLRKTLISSLVTRDEFQTVLTEAEGIVNSRPLTYVSDSFDESGPVTPQHLLTSYPLVSLPTPLEHLDNDEDYDTINLSQHYKKLLKRISEFWDRWKREYLLHLKQRAKPSGKSQISLGDVVLIEDDGPRLKWKLGWVIRLHTSPDGNSRSVVLKTRNGNVTRATVQLYPLEINCNLPVAQTGEFVPESYARPSRTAKEGARKLVKDLIQASAI